MADFIVVLTMFLDALAAMILIGSLILHISDTRKDYILRIGLLFVAVGLIGQSLRSYITFTTGVAPRDDELLWWAGKDVGIVIITFYAFFGDGGIRALTAFGRKGKKVE